MAETTAPIQALEIAEAYDRQETRRKIYSGLLLIVALAVIVSGLRAAEEANSGSLWAGLTKFFDYPNDILKESFEAGRDWFALMPEFFPLLIETINMAIAATIVGFVLAMILSFFASRNLVRNKAVVWVTRRVLDVTRAFPEIVLALFLIMLFGTNPVLAAVAIAFHSVGALGKLFSEVNENADMKPWEGLSAAGASWPQKVWFGVVPQVLPNFLSYALLRFEINVRASAIVGFVGAGGLGQKFKEVVDLKYGDEVSAIIVMLVATIMLIDFISARMRARLIGGAGGLG